MERFQRQVGTRPKTYARSLRFAHVIEIMERTAQPPTLAELAAYCGYDSHEEEDVFYVLEGTVSFLILIVVPHARLDASKGSFVLAPDGVVHGFRNQSSERAGFLNISPEAASNNGRLGLLNGSEARMAGELHLEGGAVWPRSANRYTTIPNHSGDMPEGTLSATLKQADISMEAFLEQQLMCYPVCSRHYDRPSKFRNTAE